MDPAPDEPVAPLPSRWRAHGRAALARAVASGAAMGVAAIPVAFFIDQWLVVLAGAVVGALGGAPGAAVEARAGTGRRGRALAAVACGLLLPLAGLLLSAQLVYVLGVMGGGIEHGLGRLADVVAETRREPGAMIATFAGPSLGLALPLAHVVALRLKEPDLSVAGQAGAAAIVVFVEMGALGLGGSIVMLMASKGLEQGRAIDVALSARPLVMGLATSCVLAAATLLFVGLAMTALLPGALALADRFGAPRAPAADGSAL